MNPRARIVRALIVALAWLSTVVVASGVSAAHDVGEYELKAAFLFNFAKFVKWPESALPESSGSITVCVLAEDEVARTVAETIDGKVVREKRVTVKRVTPSESSTSCHVLFVTADEAAKAEKMLRSLGDSSVLTVGEFDEFATRGGMINLRIDNNRIRFDVNPEAVKRAHLELSSQLLKLATIVRDGASQP